MRASIRWPALLGGLALIPCVMGESGRAAELELPPKAPVAGSVFDWSGFYVGGHAGYGTGRGNGVVHDPEVTASAHSFGGPIGGVQAGYNYVLPSHVLLGLEADGTFPNYYLSNGAVWSATSPQRGFTEQLDTIATVRGRLGYVFGNWMMYATGGLALSSSQVTRNSLSSDDDTSKGLTRTGWAAGAGLEYGFARAWSARLEYLYAHFGSRSTAFAPDSSYQSAMNFSSLTFGLNRKLTWSDIGAAWDGHPVTTPENNNWEIHGQTTYIQQAYPAFHSPYAGANSLSGNAQTKQTWSSSLFLTFGLWAGGELSYNPELLQGFGLSDTTGAGGFPNGEAQKSDFLYPHYNTSRLFLRQTIGFGGEQESVAGDYGQMAGKRDISRLTIQVGKFAVHDVFDNNTYAQDPRVDFLNWSIWAAGAFDYPADKVGLTYGAVAEWNQKQWALRAGYFLTGDEPNSNNFDGAVFRRGAYVTELETRYVLLSQPGKFRITGWLNNSLSGSYRGAIDLSTSVPGLDPTDAIVQTREARIKYGTVLGLEQSLTDDIAVFGRWSWNNGASEIVAFTDIDASLSGGLSIKGALWGRSSDVIGIAGAVNALSRDHRDYLAIGGLGILVGDGQLNYRQEKILEAYYAANVVAGITATLDYQVIANPADNADRGPVSIFSGRVRAAF
jgi:high affinity Mn2+ porin